MNPGLTKYELYHYLQDTPRIYPKVDLRPVLRTSELVSETFQTELRPVLRTSTYARYYVRQR